MPLITISRGSYSRGKEIAEKVAKNLGYDCISRDILLEASDEFNIPEIKLVRAIHDASSVFNRFTHGQEKYICYIRKELLQHSQKDNIVYHGLAGHYLLENIPHLLKVRIIADIEDRVKEEVKRENISAEKARYILKKDDDERRKWGLQLYGIDTWDSSLYDMVLHIKHITVDHAAEIICQTVKIPIFETSMESQQIVDDLLLATKVQAALIESVPKINVSADKGVVTISIFDKTNKSVFEIRKIAEEVEGVKAVNLNSHEKTGNGHVNPFHNI